MPANCRSALISVPRPYRVVADRIRQLIVNQRIEAGTRLPAERTLAATLSISRPVLRQALVALELEGQVEVRHGSGVYVCDTSTYRHEAMPVTPKLAGVLAARRMIEIEVASLAAKRATDANVNITFSLVSRLERGKPVNGSSCPAEHDFMLAIALLTGNKALVGVTEFLWRLQRHGCGVEPTASDRGMPYADLLDSCRTIVRAIVARDDASARRAMRAHHDRTTLLQTASR